MRSAPPLRAIALLCLFMATGPAIFLRAAEQPLTWAADLPERVAATEGRPAAIEARFSAPAPADLQWYVVYDYTSFGWTNVIFGATNFTLRFPKADSKAHGVYLLKATNSVSAIEKKFSLDVYPSPRNTITGGWEGTNGQSFVLWSADRWSIGGRQWFHNGRVIPSDPEAPTLQGTLNRATQGAYWMTGTNAAG